MHRFNSEIVVEADLRQVYNQWTQFEEFPRFMGNVSEVEQLSDRRMRWRARVLGEDVEWEAEIDEQVPDQRIVWHSVSGRPMQGAVRFEPWDMGQTKIFLEMQYELEGISENVAGALGLIERQLERDLEQFKELVEQEPHETGSWRGTLADPDAPDERALAEERQRRPGGAAPGGNPIIDEQSGEPPA